MDYDIYLFLVNTYYIIHNIIIIFKIIIKNNRPYSKRQRLFFNSNLRLEPSMRYAFLSFLLYHIFKLVSIVFFKQKRQAVK